MKKKAIKIAASTAVAASAFVAAAPAHQADAAVNVNQLVTDAQNAGTVLKWAISVEGTGNFKDQPWTEYNAAKKAIAAAEAASAKLSVSEKLSVDAKLVDAKLQLKRAGYYIDAITSSNKIKELTADLDAAIKSNDIDKVETAYHKATGEYRKQAALLDRVYGESTRKGIRDEVKPAIEKSVASVKNEVTVNMLAKSATANIKAGKLVEAAQNVADAQAILDANVLKWGTSLQKSVDDVVTSLPLSVVSVSSSNSTTAVVKLSKAVTAVHTSQFVFNNDLAVTAAVLSADGKTVTLTTTTQAAGTVYELTYNGTTAKFSTASSTSNSLITVDGSAIRSESGKNVAVSAVFKQGTGETSQSQVDILVPVALNVSSIQGKTPVVSPSTATAGFNTYRATPNASGDVSVILNAGAAAVSTDAYKSGKVEFKKLLNGKEVESKKTGTIHFYSVPNTAASLTDVEVDFVDVANKYFVVAGSKYLIKAGDALYNEQSSALTVDAFLAALKAGDTISSTNYSKASASDVRITFHKTVADFAYADKFFVNGDEDAAGYFRLDDERIKLEGTGQPTYVAHIFNSTTGTKLGTATVNGSGKWEYPTNVDNEAVTVFEVVYKASGVAYPTLTNGDGELLNVLQGKFDFTAGITATAGTPDKSLLGDTLTITPTAFAAPVYTDSIKVNAGAYIELGDGDGTVVRYVLNNSNTWSINGAGELEITFSNSFTTQNAGTTAGLQGALSIKSISGITNDYGVKLNVIPSKHVINGDTY